MVLCFPVAWRNLVISGGYLVVLGGFTLMREDPHGCKEPTCPGDSPRVNRPAASLASVRLCSEQSVFSQWMRLRGEPPASPLPPYQGQAGEEQDGTDRDVFLPRGNCSEGNLQTPAAEPHPPPAPPPPARTNPGLAVALEGTLDLAHLDVVCGIR